MNNNDINGNVNDDDGSTRINSQFLLNPKYKSISSSTTYSSTINTTQTSADQPHAVHSINLDNTTCQNYAFNHHPIHPSINEKGKRCGGLTSDSDSQDTTNLDPCSIGIADDDTRYSLYATSRDTLQQILENSKPSYRYFSPSHYSYDLTKKFGFQNDNRRNMFDHLMCMLDSRASRMSPSQALLTLHADYIGGVNANYRKWYFAARMYQDDQSGSAVENSTAAIKPNEQLEKWYQEMNSMSPNDYVKQLALYLLLWGEASVIRFTSECLCFIFKLAYDYYKSPNCKSTVDPIPEGEYLRNVIMPLYNYIRDQGYEVVDGNFVRREKDHADIIGYDDINELFWYPRSMNRIILKDKKTKLMSLPHSQRYLMLGHVYWKRVFQKTYKEKRTWLHLAVNFSRIWIIHISVFWYYTAFNAPFLYMDITNPEPAVQWSVVALGGALATLFMIAGCICEFFFIPLSKSNITMLSRRLFILLLILIVNSAPTVYICMMARDLYYSLIIGMAQFFISIITTLTFSIVPCTSLFGGYSKNSQKIQALQTFTSSFPKLNKKDRAISIGLWICIFTCKFVESYFFLSLSFKDPLKAMHDKKVVGCGEKLVGNILCTYMPTMAIIIMFITDLVLFFLDTYLWYVTWISIFSVIRSFTIGISIWTPWQNIFSMLPKRIYAKLLAVNHMELEHKAKFLVSQIWDTIVTTMYYEHLLSIDNLRKLLYQKVHIDGSKNMFKEPNIFVSKNLDNQYYPSSSEAERRISFFAQSLSTPIPDPLPIQNMPTFTVLTPHYSEKVLLSLREIIREEDQNTRVTLLEYLKQLHPIEWVNFVKDTKNFAKRSGKEKFEKNLDDLPLYSVGFKSSASEFTLRTRIWASLRSQTLYRTISGFMNYAKAIKLLYLYSVLIDGHCEILQDGRRKPKYRIQLPGNSILGDGKADNQNHAIIFIRGEYLQLIDANQDNYLEECLKIRNILGEFEDNKDPVAIVGAREYIFSENYGVLGDVAAGKEQTFGTLTQRMMAKIGGRLHYGHPDFLNAIFMTTRGGVSKAQKGLHLNEDIYAGMNAFCRGGRIKHTEYYQCGKGRDLGFGSILHFTTKIGTGMGEQMLSREYYYIGTQLPLDRFLTFYYAHPGFHINNIFIMFSMQLFMIGMMFIGALTITLEHDLCEYNPDLEAPLYPPGCYNLVPIFDWIKRSITSIFLVIFISFLSLFLQELTEKGLIRSILRLGRHFISLSPFFEVFTTQIYAYSILTNLSFGGARYIATGRGFATARIPFSVLYSLFTRSSIYLGMRILVILIFVSITMWLPHLIYFWVSAIALCISPFLFNPHQFSFIDFIIDYREFLRWMSRGNSKSHLNSWISYCRISRTMVTGYKKKKLGHSSSSSKKKSVVMTVGGGRIDVTRPSFFVIFFSEIFSPFVIAVLCIIVFTFIKSFDSKEPGNPNNGPSPIIRVIIIAIGPILLNAVMLLGFFILSIFFGSSISLFFEKFGSIIAAVVHTFAIVNLIGTFEILWYLESWRLSNAILGMIVLIAIQRFIFKLMIALFLTRELKHDETNRAWWSGKWYGRGFGFGLTLTQPFREYICKIVEMSLFATDFVIGHILLFMLIPFLFIPWIDKLHSTMLFWLRPSKQIRPPIYSIKQKKRRRRIVWTYGLLFLLMFIIFVGLIVGPLFVGNKLRISFKIPI
nr:5734_t:CDS:2 [Entrophospora candida]